MTTRSGPQALRVAIHVARARAGFPSDHAMAMAAGLSYDTLMNWYAGRTVPRPAAVKKLASVLGVPYDSLLAAYEGREQQPQELAEAIRDLVGEMRAARIAQERRTDTLERLLIEVVHRDRNAAEAAS